MTEVYADDWLTIHGGDARAALNALPERSVHAVITSPPYWGLRDYGTATWIGGDADCDHRHPTEHQRQGATSQRGGRSNTEAQRNENFRETCGKCGAIRQEAAAWGGDPDHEHVWGVQQRGRRADLKPSEETTSTGRLGSDDRQGTGLLDGGRFCDCGAWRGQLGLEPSAILYIDHLVEVARTIWRVLRDDGTLWLNLGDSFAAKPRGSDEGWDQSRLTNPGQMQKRLGQSMDRSGPRHRGKTDGLKEKDLVGIPWMAAFALREDGWYLRRDVIWAKDNSMPESVDDRPSSSHEYVFMLTKSGSPLYWTHRDGRGSRVGPAPDWIWVRRDDPTVERGEQPDDPPNWRRKNLWEGHDYVYDWFSTLERASYPEAVGSPIGGRKRAGGQNPKYSGDAYDATALPGRRLRSVWRVNTQPYPGAHYAVFPQRLVEPMIKASTSGYGCCAECGAPWVKHLIRDGARPDRGASNGIAPENEANGTRDIDPTAAGGNWLAAVPLRDAGWQPTCEHTSPLRPTPAVVLDPFAGSGTVGMVANRLSRRAVLVDLQPEYLRQQMERNRDVPLGLTE